MANKVKDEEVITDPVSIIALVIDACALLVDVANMIHLGRSSNRVEFYSLDESELRRHTPAVEIIP